MKYVDFVAQSLILGLTLAGALLNLNSHPDTIVFTGAFLLGSWQLLSSLISVAYWVPLHKLKRIHLIISVIYLIALGVLQNHPTLFDSHIMVALIYSIPIALAVFYYGLTCRWAFSRKSNGSFLRHISF